MALPAVCVLALWAVLAANLGAVRAGFGAIGTGSGPNVEACGRLYYDLADMDGRAADLLLIGDGSTPTESRATESAALRQDQADANTQLEIVGSGIDGIPQGAAEFVALENGLSQYSQDISQALYIDGRDHGQIAGQPPAAALAAYQAGTAVLHRAKTGVLAEAEALLKGDQSTLDAKYSGVLGTIGQLRLWGISLTLLVIAALIGVQGRLRHAFKRRINPLMMLATLLTAVFGVLLWSGLDTAQDTYAEQKSQALDSVIALWQDQAVSADMNASESRWLLDIAGTASNSTADQIASTAEQAQFYADAEQVAAEAHEVSDWQYGVDLQQAAKSLYDAPNGPAGSFTGGYLGTEMANITFVGEQQDADAAFKAYAQYIADDEKFRGLADAPGSTGAPGAPAVAAAAAFDTGQVEHDFTGYLTAVNDAFSINQYAFTQATAHGTAALRIWLPLPAIWALLTLAAIALGFAPRLHEYRRS